ncbi:Protein ALF [Apostasia shenzhenica]|uniref:Floricaula/leafy-like transcription factor n=1 Tax=Apostasia shenzhenica TaxID=1088818 RepID=A0A2I0AW13_9ASPA|nr:Protein ALF [Apostasia shenzhenica]
MTARRRRGGDLAEMNEDDDDAEGSESSERGVSGERQREHPFIVTEPRRGGTGEEERPGPTSSISTSTCHEFLLQLAGSPPRAWRQSAPPRCSDTRRRWARATSNKPKMRHYVHCYALTCWTRGLLTPSGGLSRSAARTSAPGARPALQALVAISAAHAFDVDAVFNAHPCLSIWVRPHQGSATSAPRPQRTASSLPAALPPPGGGSATLLKPRRPPRRRPWPPAPLCSS